MNWSLISDTNSSTSSPREPAVTIAIWIVSSGTKYGLVTLTRRRAFWITAANSLRLLSFSKLGSAGHDLGVPVARLVAEHHRLSCPAAAGPGSRCTSR